MTNTRAARADVQIGHATGGCRTARIRARGGDRAAERLRQRPRHAMIRHAQGQRALPGMHRGADTRRRRKDKRQRTGPAARRHPPRQLVDRPHKCFDLRKRRGDQRQRGVARPSLELEQRAHRRFRAGIDSQPVERVGRKRDDAALAQPVDGRREVTRMSTSVDRPRGAASRRQLAPNDPRQQGEPNRIAEKDGAHAQSAHESGDDRAHRETNQVRTRQVGERDARATRPARACVAAA